jgi:hypothetical protein
MSAMSPLLLQLAAATPIIPARPPISGPLWTIVIPALLFVVSFGATYLLYRKFSDHRGE